MAFIEILLPLLTPVGKILGWGWKTYRSLRRRLTPGEIIDARAKWRREFDDHGISRRQFDVIIRDLDRHEQYPDNEPKGWRRWLQPSISPWFRVGLMGTCNEGIYVLLQYQGLKEDAQGAWRVADTSIGETVAINALLMGVIPFESIHSVNWDGEDHYAKPQIFCYFDQKDRQPYLSLGYYEDFDLNGHRCYRLIDTYQNVEKRTVDARERLGRPAD